MPKYEIRVQNKLSVIFSCAAHKLFRSTSNDLFIAIFRILLTPVPVGNDVDEMSVLIGLVLGITMLGETGLLLIPAILPMYQYLHTEQLGHCCQIHLTFFSDMDSSKLVNDVFVFDVLYVFF